ncbi:hypothetical protein HPB47_006250 [Ixodes persulcatus]|uniref:Uncharacterized protein n=1 Tax=Ixodes persulcatus TaxID=34615 RepID=A0AC60PBH9_IXOPE|nr:hypothetical protein HPB47_006250 [Ixodes persulcatus]
MDCGQSSDETLQGGTRKRKTNADLATNLAENEDNGQLTTVSEKHLQLRSILATLLAEESQENLIAKILGLLTEITAKKKTSRKRSKTLKETETAKDSPTSNAKPSATHTQESRSKSISAPLQQENEATPPGEQQPLRQPQPSGKDTTKGGQDKNAADNDDDGFIKVTNKRKRPRREPQPDTQKPNEHLKEVRIRPKSKTPMGEWKLEILGYLEKTLEIKLPVVAARRMGNTKTVTITFEGEKLPRSILFNRYHAPLCGRTHPREGMDTDTSESECPDTKTYCQLCKKEGHLATDKNCATKAQAMKAQARSSQVGARIETVPDPSSNRTAAPAAPTATPQTTVPAKSPSPTSLASSYANDDTPFEKRLTDALKIATIIKEVDEDIPVPDLYLLKLWAKRLQALQAYRKGPKTVYGRRKVTRITIEARYYAKRLERQRWLDYSASLSEKTSISHAAESPQHILMPDATATTCASSSKLSHSAARFEELKASVSDCDYELIDIDLLSCSVAESWVCKVCGGDLQLVEKAALRAGVACTYFLNCEKCCWTHRLERRQNGQLRASTWCFTRMIHDAVVAGR